MGRMNLVRFWKISIGRRISLSPKIATLVWCLASMTVQMTKHPAFKEILCFGKFEYVEAINYLRYELIF
jgi:hypothetical protein